jgi:hypothetical protein
MNSISVVLAREEKKKSRSMTQFLWLSNRLLYTKMTTDTHTEAIYCKQCGHAFEHHTSIGCDRFMVRNEVINHEKVIRVEFCKCTMKMKDLLGIQSQNPNDSQSQK